MWALSVAFAYLAMSFVPSNIQLVGAVDWDRPKADPFSHSPDVIYTDNSFNTTYPTFESIIEPDSSMLNTRAAKEFYLRIMPLGASITRGQESTDGNGYRKALRQQLRWKGWKVNMVGSRRDGNMNDNDNEGWSGYVINSVYNEFKKSAHLKPNLVLVNAGTNDCGDNGDGANAKRDMKDMLNGIYASIDGVTIILSTLLPKATNNACVSFVSEQYRSLVRDDFAGRRIGLADINSALPASMLVDGTHPNDEGYRLFAAVWWDAISKMEDVFQPPLNNGQEDATGVGNTCQKVPGTAREVKSQQGSGHNDGNYVHSSESLGVLESARIEHKTDPDLLNALIPDRMFFANLIKTDPNAERSQALDDWIRVWHKGDDDNYVWNVRRNKGNGEFDKSQEFKLDQDCVELPGLYGFDFADFNGDGLDDFFCYKKDGAVTVSLNRGGNPPKFENIGQVIGGAGSVDWDYDSQRYQFADIDGDGRADFCILDSNAVRCSRNAGVGDQHFWQGFKEPGTIRDVVFSHGRTGLFPVDMRLGDINGDFRADFFYITDHGSIETWINTRGWGKTIVPEWRYAGQTHAGQAVDHSIRGRIKLAKIMGTGRLDYVYIVQKDTYTDVVVWKNTGSGGTKLNADGNFYCDMRGTGADDLVWIYDGGSVDEINTNIHSPPNWGHDTSISFSVPGPRVGIHLADWTGDGRCDILVQDKRSGALSLWENNYNQGTKSITFTSKGVVASPACTAGWGVSIFDRGMRIADVDGDGRADVLCLNTNGRIDGWLNRAGGLMSVGQVKFAEAWDRANLRFTDVEASGRADIIWMDKYTGASTVFKNEGFKGIGGGPGGSSFQWTNRGILYSGISRGENLYFTNQGGLGRADLVRVNPSTNVAYTNLNECGASGGDEGPVVSPGLPDYSSGVKPVKPSPGDEITLHKTRNNLNDGSFTEDGGDVTINVGDRLGSGSKGEVYDVDCRGRSECQDLGNIVLKYYTDTDVIQDERKWLAKIDELKAVIKSDKYGQLTLLTKWEGVNFDRLPTWQKLSDANPQDKQAMKDFVDQAVTKITENAQGYIRDHRVYHLDVTNANSLLKESDGRITEAHIIDWDDAAPVDDDQLQEALDAMKDQVDQAFDRFRPE